MKLHTGMKILILVIELAVVGLLIFSIYPIVDNGIDFEADDMSANVDDNGIFTVEGSATITSKMPWDINVSYDIILGTEEFSVASTGLIEKRIPSNGSEVLDLTFQTHFLSVALLLLDSGLDDEGNMGTMKLPILLKMHGDYINGIVGLDLKIQIESELDFVDGIIFTDSNKSMIKGENIIFSNPDGSILPPMTSGGFEIKDGAGNVAVEGNFDLIPVMGTEDELKLNFDIHTLSGDSLTEVIESLVNEDGELVIDYPGGSYKFKSWDVQKLIKLIMDILSKLGVI